MGMFDYIVCDHPLPSDPPEFCAEPGHHFQTKSLDCIMATLVITKDGRLGVTNPGAFFDAIVPENYVDLESYKNFTGEIGFYDSNLVAAAHGIAFTKDGSAAVSVDYSATFVEGKLIELIETHRRVEPALASADFYTHEDAKEEAEDEAIGKASLAGRTMWMKSYGRDEPDKVEVVADGSEEWCVKDEKGRLHLVQRWQSRLFESPEACKKHEDDVREKRDREAAYYADLLAKKQEQRNASSQ